MTLTSYEIIEFVDESVEPTGTPDLDAQFLNDHLQQALHDVVAEVIAHVGAGAAAHALAVSGGANGFFSGTEKAKLAAIETGATADMTAAEILAALLTVDGAGSGLDADTLDGLSSGSFVPIAHVGAGGTAHADVVAAGAAGFMSGADKTKLNGIATGATAEVDASETAKGRIERATTAEAITGTDTERAVTPAGAKAVMEAHVGASDPHTDYQKESEKGSANGYAGLGSDGKVPSAQLPTASSGAAPVGGYFPFAGFTLPENYVWGDGAALSRTTYATLFEAITFLGSGNTTSGSATVSGFSSTSLMWVGMRLTGSGIPANATVASIVNSTTITISANATATASGVSLRFYPWGAGDGSTTFNAPDLRSRTPVGAGQGSGLANRKAGERFGEETHALTAAQNGPHVHDMKFRTVSTTAVGGAALRMYDTSTAPLDLTAATESSGSGTAHNNVQPSIGTNWIVKAA